MRVSAFAGDVTRLLPSLTRFEGSVDLVTADGSCYTQVETDRETYRQRDRILQDHPEEQEATVAPILEAEVACGLAVLRQGGGMVVKVNKRQE